jgi:small subunit ribosomal protein S3
LDYGFTEAHTTLGRIGVKVWIYKGDILPEAKATEVEAIPAEFTADESVAEKTDAEPEKVVVKPVTDADIEETSSVEVEEKPAKPAPEAKAIESEENDVTTQAGEIPESA